MPLSAGDKLGPYEILAPLGAGGMGEVYRAHDSRLKRDVAIKVLPAELSFDPERMARFEREARLLASLDHTNIGAIYGLEESNGTRALILALIEGPTLADRIAAGPIPLEEAIYIAQQINAQPGSWAVASRLVGPNLNLRVANHSPEARELLDQ